MPTKCIVLGEVKPPAKKAVPIEFKYYINEKGEKDTTRSRKPNEFTEIELISKNYTCDGLDLMFAMKYTRSDSMAIAFFGHWNDGVAE